MKNKWGLLLLSFVMMMMLYPLMYLVGLNEVAGGVAFDVLKYALVAMLFLFFLYPFVEAFNRFAQGRRGEALVLAIAGVFIPVLSGIACILFIEVAGVGRKKSSI